MSTQNAIQFLEQAWSDEELKARLQDKSNVEEIVEIASEQGYEFSADEFYEGQMEVLDKYGVELSEEQLRCRCRRRRRDDHQYGTELLQP